MNLFVATGAGFLLAVLWFDLMFDVQVRKHEGEVLPADVLASISAYYRRVTTEASPMNRLVALAMILTLAAIVAEIVEGASPAWASWLSLAIAGVAIVPSALRTVPNAVRLGAALDPPEEQSRLARDIYRLHVVAFVCMAVVLILQILGR